MRPLAEWRGDVERLTVQEFCAAHPHPFLISAVSKRPLAGSDRTHGLTIDRVVLPGEAPGGYLASSVDDYLAAELKPREPMRSREITIGFSSHCDLRINDASVSKLHAIVNETSRGWRIRDAESLTGTRVNDDEPIHPLESGDRITVGLTDLIFLMPAELFHLVRQLEANRLSQNKQPR